MTVTRAFVHGLEGSSTGTKASFFRARCPGMIIEDFRGPLENRMSKLEALLSNKASLIIVGSSFGGLVATIFAYHNAPRLKQLILLAPALSLPEFEPYLEVGISVPALVYHGTKDHVVPVGPVHSIAKRAFSDLEFIMVEDDHFLSKTFKNIDWDVLLGLEPVERQISPNR